MANDKVKKTDLVDGDAIIAIQYDFALLNGEIDKTLVGFKSLIKESRNLANINNVGNAKEFVELNKTIADGNTKMLLAVKLKKEQADLEKKLIAVSAAKRKEEDAAAKAVEKTRKEEEKKNSAYQQAVKRLNEVKKLLKDEAVESKLTAAETAKLREEFTNLDTKVRNAEEGVNEFQRSVGNYKNSIIDALNETGLFSNGLFKLVAKLGEVKKAQDSAANGSGKFSNALKLVGIGLAIAALTAFVNIAKAGVDQSQALSDAADKLSIKFGQQGAAQAAAAAASAIAGYNVNLAEGRRLSLEYIDLLSRTRKELRALELQFQLVSLDEQDFNEISADGTIGFKERNAALKEAIELSRQRAGLGVSIAQKEFDLVNKEVEAQEKIVGAGNVKAELLEKRLQAELKLNTALDEQGDLIRVNAQRERQQNVDRAIAEIDLILKKKQSANAEKVILENQLADNKVQLEERRKTAEQLLAVNRKTTEEEIKIFKDNIGVEFDANDLLAEQDAIKLKRKLEDIKLTKSGLTLGESAVAELAKIVKQAQENEIANKETIKKLDEEELKRKQRISEINKEISILNKQEQIAETVKITEDALRNYDKATLDLEKRTKLFSFGLRKQRKEEFEKAISNLLGESSVRKELLEEQAKLDRERAENSINDEKIRAKEIERINQKLANDLLQLNRDQAEKERELQKQKEEDDKRLLQQRQQRQLDFLQQLTSETANEFQKRNDLENQAIEQSISDREKEIDRQAELAATGRENSLAEQKANLAKDRAAQREELEKQRREQEGFALASALESNYANEVANGVPSSVALARAFAATFTIKGLAKALAGYHDGGYTGDGDEYDPAGIVHKKEFVMTAEKTDKHYDLFQKIHTGAISDKTLHDFNNGTLLPDYAIYPQINPVFSTAENMFSQLALQQLGEMKEIKAGIQKMVDNIPQTTIGQDLLGNMKVDEKYASGVTQSYTKVTRNRVIS